MAHDPDLADRRLEGSRKGGSNRANSSRAARNWAALGKELDDQDIAAVLKSCMFAVRDKKMLPNEAQAIANLARTSIQITGDLQLEARIVELERAAGIAPDAGNIRRVS